MENPVQIAWNIVSFAEISFKINLKVDPAISIVRVSNVANLDSQICYAGRIWFASSNRKEPARDGWCISFHFVGSAAGCARLCPHSCSLGTRCGQDCWWRSDKKSFHAGLISQRAHWLIWQPISLYLTSSMMVRKKSSQENAYFIRFVNYWCPDDGLGCLPVTSFGVL